MREIIKLMEQASEPGSKLDRSTFLYLEPWRDEDQFAQCGTCVMFMPDSKRCGIFGPEDVVIADASCGLYVQGDPSEDQQPTGFTTPEAAGYVTGQVRCENCSWASAGRCGFFEELNQRLPSIFDLDPNIAPKGCCNAWQGRG